MSTPSGKPRIAINTNPDGETGAPRLDEEILETVVEKAPPWLFSTVVHILLLIALALVAMNLPKNDSPEIIIQPIEYDDKEKKFDEKIGDPDEDVTPIQAKDPEDDVDNPILTPETDPTPQNPENVLPPIDDPDAPGISETDPNRHPIVTIMNVETRMDANARRTAMTDGGGDETTEAAVIRGLKWLQRHQFPDGSWSLRGSRFRGGSYADGIRSVDNRIAATGLALLAFQGQGNTLERGEFSESVKKGWVWLIEKQQPDGCFYDYDVATQDHRFYTQGICTIAVCELYAMTPKDHLLKEDFRSAAQLAVDYCVQTQSNEGGWRYGVNKAGISEESDLSVTGWIVMALQSAKMAGLEVPQSTFDHITGFLNDIGQEDGSRYPYRKRDGVTRSMTAEGLLCREFLGWARDDERLASGLRWLVRPENLVNYKKIDDDGRKGNERDVYYWYYATQALHHYGGSHWKKWNDVMKQEVCSHQFVKANHKDDGSWDPNLPTRDKWASEGGRLYVTCLSIYMLEVYYRHLPIYRTISFE